MTLLDVRFNALGGGAALLSLLATACFDPETGAKAGDTDGTESSSSGTTAGPSGDSAASTTGQPSTTDAVTSSSSTDATTGAASTGDAGDDSSSTAAEETGTETDVDPDTGSSSSGEPEPLLCGDGMVVAGEICFDDAAVINAGDIGYSPRVGDVNGDGDVDLLYLYIDQVVVRLGDGTGSFGPELTDETFFCDQMELADVNGDEVLDVVGTTVYSDFLTVALGTGTGSFSLQDPLVTLNPNPVQLVAGDLTGDGNADVLSIHGIDHGGSGAVRAAASNGAGGFSVTDYISTLSGPGRDVTLGDFTGDGILDTAFTLGTGTSQIRISINNGTAQFGQSLAVNVTTSDATGIDAGDLNGDGDDDLAVGNGDDVLVLLGTGAASFMPAISLPAAGHATFVTIDDVTGDGVGDIIAIYDDTFAVSVFPSAGDGTFGERVDLSIGVTSDSLATGDVNDDGIPDLITGSTDDELITILISTP